MTMQSDTQAITLPASAADDFAFLADPENLPRWAVGFARGVRRDDRTWIVQTAQGEVPVRVEAGAARGTIDFHLGVAPGVEAVAYSRVLPNDAGADYVFTQVQGPGMPDEVFAAQRAALAEELALQPILFRAQLACRIGRERRDRDAQLREGRGTMERAATPPLEELVARAQAGDWAALEAVVAGVRDRVYNLAVRMLWHPADAEDATQEILVRIVTHLGSFRGESAFTTWAYRVAANHLLTTRKRRAEREELTFERFAEQLDVGLAPAAPGPAYEVEQRLLAEEVKLGCTSECCCAWTATIA